MTVVMAAQRPPCATALLLRLGELPPDHPDRAALRARVIEWYLPMAAGLARRFAGRGEPTADLNQVSIIGLIKAIDRFDATHGAAFAAYAIPTIVGELKRHFRDAAWNVRVPRRLQELRLHLATVTDDLAQLLHRSPTTAEVAVQFGVTEHEILQALDTATAYRPVSLQQPAAGRDDLLLIDLLSVTDHGFEAVDDRETLRVLLAELTPRERTVIHMRFYDNMTQSQIATQIGVSQMHVSHLLARCLTRLRRRMLSDARPVPVGAGPAAGLQHAPTPAARTTHRTSASSVSPAGPVFPPGG